MFGIQGGPYSTIAGKLRELNFQVVEKDFSGQPNPRPMVEEATDEQLKNCAWIVVAPSSKSNPTLAQKLKEHLDDGGSAMVLTTLKGDDFAPALDPWASRSKPTPSSSTNPSKPPPTLPTTSNKPKNSPTSSFSTSTAITPSSKASIRSTASFFP